MNTDPTMKQLSIEDTFSGIKIIWQGKRNWRRIQANAITFVYYLFFIWLALNWYQKGAFEGISLQAFLWFLVILLVVFVLYYMFKQAVRLLESLLDHELIQLDNRAVTIERSGFLNIKRQVVYPAERIRSIRLTASAVSSSLWIDFAPEVDRSTRIKLPAGTLFCRGIGETDATAVLGRIYERFPRYQEIKT